jgi:hypothetical protein
VIATPISDSANGDAEGAEDGIDPPHHDHRKQHQADVEQAIERPVNLAAAIHEAQPAPEGHQPAPRREPVPQGSTETAAQVKPRSRFVIGDVLRALAERNRQLGPRGVGTNGAVSPRGPSAGRRTV